MSPKFNAIYGYLFDAGGSVGLCDSVFADSCAGVSKRWSRAARRGTGAPAGGGRAAVRHPRARGAEPRDRGHRRPAQPVGDHLSLRVQGRVDRRGPRTTRDPDRPAPPAAHRPAAGTEGTDNPAAGRGPYSAAGDRDAALRSLLLGQADRDAAGRRAAVVRPRHRAFSAPWAAATGRLDPVRATRAHGGAPARPAGVGGGRPGRADGPVPEQRPRPVGARQRGPRRRRHPAGVVHADPDRPRGGHARRADLG